MAVQGGLNRRIVFKNNVAGMECYGADDWVLVA